MIVWHLKQIKKGKKAQKVGALMSWLKIKKCVTLKCHLLLFCTTTNHFLHLVMGNKKWTLHDNQDDQLSGWTKKQLQSTSQSQTCSKKGPGHCVVVCSRSDPLQLSESQWNRYIWELCSANDEMHWKLQCLQPAPVNRMGPILLHANAQPNVTQTMLQRLNKLGYQVLPHLPYSPDLSPTDYHFFKHLNNILQGKRFYNQQDAENAFPEFVKSQGTYFYATGISILFSRWQKCVDCNGSYFD